MTMKRTKDWPAYEGWIVVYPTGRSPNEKPNIQFCAFGANVYSTQKEAWEHAGNGTGYSVARVEVLLPPLWGNQRQQGEAQK